MLKKYINSGGSEESPSVCNIRKIMNQNGNLGCHGLNLHLNIMEFNNNDPILIETSTESKAYQFTMW